MTSNPGVHSLLRTESFGSASVTWLDRRAAKKAARDAAAALALARPEVVGVLLFGSVARGDAVPASDVDLLVVLRDSPLPFLDRIPLYTPAVPPLAVDALPYTVAEVLTLRAQGHSLLARALAEGEWIVGPPPSIA
jgi:uncharacterized protein